MVQNSITLMMSFVERKHGCQTPPEDPMCTAAAMAVFYTMTLQALLYTMISFSLLRGKHTTQIVPEWFEVCYVSSRGKQVSGC